MSALQHRLPAGDPSFFGFISSRLHGNDSSSSSHTIFDFVYSLRFIFFLVLFWLVCRSAVSLAVSAVIGTRTGEKMITSWQQTILHVS